MPASTLAGFGVVEIRAKIWDSTPVRHSAGFGYHTLPKVDTATALAARPWQEWLLGLRFGRTLGIIAVSARMPNRT